MTDIPRSNAPHPDLREFLVHESFLRGIALAVLADPGDADDVLQETWLRALAKPPRDRASARPWLATVVRNVLFSSRRRAAVRARALAPLEPNSRGPDPAEIAAREGLRRSVVEAVLELPVKHRDAVLLLYFEGLAPRQAAERLGIPVNTLLSRVHRARIELRRRLVDEDGDPRVASARLAALARAGLGKVAVVAAPRALVLGTAALAAGAAAALVLVLRGGSPEPLPAPVDPAVTASAPLPAPIPAVAPPAVPLAGAAERFVATFRVAGTVRGFDLAPVAGATVRAVGPGGPTETTTDAGGAFGLDFPAPGPVDLRVATDRHLPRLVRADAKEGEPAAVEVFLEPGVPVAGRVSDARSGRPLEGARIALGYGAFGRPAATATTESDGAFELMAPDVAGPLSATAPGYGRTQVMPFVPREGEPVALALTPEAADATAFVRVRDGTGGFVEFVEALPGPVETRGSGVLAIGARRVAAFAGRGPSLSLRLRLPGGEWSQLTLPAAESTDPLHPREVDLPAPASRPAEPRRREGVVVAAGGAPVAGARVRAGDRCAWTDAAGRFELDAADGARLEVVAEGFATRRETIAAETLKPTLERATVIAGRVVRADGRGVAGARVVAQPVSQIGSGGNRTTFGSLGDASTGFETFADREGRFRIGDLPPGEYGVTADRGAAAADPFGAPIASRPPADAAPIEIVVRAPATLHGVPVDSATGAPIAFHHRVEGAAAIGSNLALGSGRQDFVHLVGEGDRVAVVIDGDRGLSLRVPEIAVAEGSWRTLRIELPASAPEDAGGGTLALQVNGFDEGGVRVALLRKDGDGTAIRIGLLGFGAFSATIPRLAPGEYAVSVTRPDGSLVPCPTTTVSIAAGAPATLVVAPP